KTHHVKRVENEQERKARVDAIWAEMNQKQEKQPLDDISSSVNRSTSEDHAKDDAKEQEKTKIVRPKSNLSALVSQYNIKVPKMNTLEKSRLDWQGYVDREGIRDDLKYKNKDGYMEKVAFLQRVDDRRLSHLKAGQKASKK
ncbi:bucentaur or craniofacial development-domain-containing protein, partial [Fennellomyces sp. T-0311]